jgi:hypothetical protein
MYSLFLPAIRQLFDAEQGCTEVQGIVEVSQPRLGNGDFADRQGPAPLCLEVAVTRGCSEKTLRILYKNLRQIRCRDF